MPQVVIENPILNSPFDEPTRHFQFGDEGITNEIVEKRRTSSYFIPIAQPKKKGKQLQFETEWTKDRLEENRVVNLYITEVAAKVRRRVDRERPQGGQRHAKSRSTPDRAQDGHGVRQDRRDGHAHRLAGAEQAGGSA